ncbi:hypothetical protein FO519_009996, partial [Halicephalobus sp. NKZ332]
MTSTTSTTSSNATTTTAPGTCCNEWSAWAGETTCGDYCGGCAVTNFTRTCLTASTCPCPGESTKVAPCNLGPCAYPRPACCGSLTPRPFGDTILCIPPGTVDVVPQTCSCCPEQGIWSSWSSPNCNDTCGGYGSSVMSRTCLSEPSGCPCTGNQTMTAPCNFGPCAYPRKACTGSYRVGVVNGQVACMIPTTTFNDTITPTSCCPAAGLWELWGSWSNCSTSCGGCSTATRTRTCASEPYGCPCDDAPTSETLPCNRQACTSSPQCCVGTVNSSAPTQVCLGTNTTLALASAPTAAPITTTEVVKTTSAPTAAPIATTEVAKTTSASGVWSAWSDSGCTDTCGLCGMTTQMRTCISGSCT